MEERPQSRLDGERTDKTSAIAEPVFTSGTWETRGKAIVLRLALGALAGLVISLTIMNLVCDKSSPLDHPFGFFGGGIAGAFLGSLVPRRLDTLRIRSNAVILSNAGRSVRIPADHIRIIHGLSTFPVDPETLKSEETAVIAFWTPYSRRCVRLRMEDVHIAMRALLAAYPNSIGMSESFEIRLPQDGIRSLSQIDISNLTALLTRETWQASVRGIAALLLAAVFMAFTVTLIVVGGKDHVTLIAHFLLGCVTLAVGGFLLLGRAQVARETKRNFGSTMEGAH